MGGTLWSKAGDVSGRGEERRNRRRETEREFD